MHGINPPTPSASLPSPRGKVFHVHQKLTSYKLYEFLWKHCQPKYEYNVQMLLIIAKLFQWLSLCKYLVKLRKISTIFCDAAGKVLCYKDLFWLYIQWTRLLYLNYVLYMLTYTVWAYCRYVLYCTVHVTILIVFEHRYAGLQDCLLFI